MQILSNQKIDAMNDVKWWTIYHLDKNREKDVNMDYMGQEPLTYLYLLLQDTVNKKRNEKKLLTLVSEEIISLFLLNFSIDFLFTFTILIRVEN